MRYTGEKDRATGSFHMGERLSWWNHLYCLRPDHEDQRAQAHTRFTIIRPALEDGVIQAQVARTHHISKSTIHRWVKRYRENGLAGLADAKGRSDKGKSRCLPPDAITLIEGLALQPVRNSRTMLYAVSHRLEETISFEAPKAYASWNGLLND